MTPLTPPLTSQWSPVDGPRAAGRETGINYRPDAPTTPLGRSGWEGWGWGVTQTPTATHTDSATAGADVRSAEMEQRLYSGGYVCNYALCKNSRAQGRTQGEGLGARALPLGPKKYEIISVNFVKLRDFCLCNTCSTTSCYVEGPKKPVAW